MFAVKYGGETGIGQAGGRGMFWEKRNNKYEDRYVGVYSTFIETT